MILLWCGDFCSWQLPVAICIMTTPPPSVSSLVTYCIMQVKLATGSCHEQKTHQSKIKGTLKKSRLCVLALHALAWVRHLSEWPFTFYHAPSIRGPPVLFSQLMRWRGYWLCGGGLAPPMQKVGCVVVVELESVLENRPPWGTGWCCCGCVLALPVQLLHPVSFTSWMSFMLFTMSSC